MKVKNKLDYFLQEKKLKVKIEFFNERETTKFAKQLGIKDKKQINHVAASSILEGYFNILDELNVVLLI